jgi:fibronectin-binding autotransporter adhesin
MEIKPVCGGRKRLVVKLARETAPGRRGFSIHKITLEGLQPMKPHQTISNRLGPLAALASFVLFTASVVPMQADQNWDGDNAVGNLSFNNNWFSDVQPSWGFGGSLHFAFHNNGSQTSIFQDYGTWVNTDNIFWDSGFNTGTSFNSGGNGIDFNQRIENDSSFIQTLNCPTSGNKNGAGHIELNPVNGDLTLSASVFNDNNSPYQVWGGNSKSLNIGVGLTGNSSVTFTIEQNSKAKFTAAQTWGDSTHGATVLQGELWIDSGGSLNSGIPVSVGAADANTAKMWIATATGGTTVVQNITVANSGGTKVIGGLNTSGVNTFTGNITLNGPVNLVSDKAGGAVEFKTGIISGGNSVNINNTATSASTVTLSGANTYSGGTTLGAGTLAIGNDGALGTGTFTIANSVGIQSADGTAHTITNALGTLTGSSVNLTFGAVSGGTGALTFTNNFNIASGSATRTFTVINSTTFGGVISGVGGTVLVKAGTGTLTLNGANTWGSATGGFTLNAGTVNINNAAALGNAANTMTISGGTIDNTATGAVTTGNYPQAWNGDFTFTGTQPLNLGFGAVTLGLSRQVTVNASTLTVGGIISGSGFGLTKAGSGTLTLGGANTYSGNTTINGGLLALSGSGSIANSPNIIMGSGGTFDVSSLTTALILGSSQTLKASATGVNTTGTLTMGSTKGLTLSAGGLAFTAYGGGSTAPLTAASAGSLTLNSAPVTVTTSSALAAGTYKLIAKSGSATVSGTPGTLTVNGSGVVSGATPTLQVASGELWLYVPGISSSGTLSAFTTTYGTASASQNVSVSGTGLSGNLTTTAPTGFQVSSDNSTWNTSASFTQSGGSASGTLYVRLAATANAGSYNTANIALLSTGANGVNVTTSASGNVVSALAVGLFGSRNYDGTTNAAAAILSVTNKVGSDTVNVASGTGGLAGKNVGTQTITSFGTLALGNNAAGNYTLTGASGSVTINATNLTVTATTNTKTYDGTTNAAAVPTIMSGSLQGSDTASFTETYDTKDAGTGKTLTPAGVVTDGNSGNNYNYTYTTVATGIINQANTPVSVASSLNPSGYKDSVTFTAALPSDAGTTVHFLTNGVLFDTETLSGGSATSLSITNLPRGTNTITVQYAGDSNYSGSTNDLVGGQVVTNHPPVAGDTTCYRAKGISLKITISDLLTNVTDADGDTITLSGAGSGTNGATILTNDTGIYYLPSTGAGSNYNDSFTYTTSDGYGGSATGNINVNVYSAAGPAQVSIPTNGVVNIKFFGIPAYAYVVATTTNLDTAWWPLSTNTAGSDGSWQFTDLNATNAQQYYRMQQP